MFANKTHIAVECFHPDMTDPDSYLCEFVLDCNRTLSLPAAFFIRI